MIMNKVTIGSVIGIIAVVIVIVLSKNSEDTQDISSALAAERSSYKASAGFTEDYKSSSVNRHKVEGKLDTANYKRSDEYKKTSYFNQAQEVILNDPKEWFPDAETLAKEGQPEVVYVEALRLLLDEYLVVVKSGYPIGVNVEVTNALLGDNPKKLALLDQEHSRINEEGELVDQWDTPYFFHANSLSDVDVRSAGPDRKMFSEDDIISGVDDL